MYLSICYEATGGNICRLMDMVGCTVRQVAYLMGVTPQAVYRWRTGDSLPDIVNLIILSRILHCSIEDILVVEEHN